jgi:hypothetical protein
MDGRKKIFRPTSFLECILVQDLHKCRFIRKRRYELVIDDDDAIIFCVRSQDKVGYTGGVGERRDISTDLIEGERQVLSNGTRKLSFRLVTNDHNRRIFLHGMFCILQRATGSFGDGGVDTAAEAFV